VPPIILGLAKAPIVSEFDLRSLDVIISGAAPLPLDVCHTAGKRLGCIIKQGWGMSELSGTGSTNPDDGNREGSSGRPLTSMEFKIIDVDNGSVLPPGVEGEVVCKGPNIMTGYLNNPQATANAFTTDGWFKTGDIAVADEDGYLRFTDRLKELIKYKGFQVAPAELEALLLTHPAVADAAVIGIPDEEAGEVPCAFVVMTAEDIEDNDTALEGIEKKSFCDSSAISSWVAERVAPHKKIRGGIIQVEQIPKSPSGKILRRILQKQHCQHWATAHPHDQKRAGTPRP
jgi:4-coumarate--CoA ligase